MVKILNIEILSIRKQELLEQLENGVLFTPNIDHVVRLQKDRTFYKAYQQADWVRCDRGTGSSSRFICDMQFFWYYGKQLIGLYKNPFV